MDDKAAKDLKRSVDANTKAVTELTKELRKRDQGQRRTHTDPAQPPGTVKKTG